MRSLGVDYGEKRVGLAISDPDGIIATPLKVLDVSGLKDAVAQAILAITEHQAEQVVVGLPLNMDGTEGPSAMAALKFVDALSGAVDVPVVTEDERLTTKMVERMLLEGDVSRAKRKKVRDKLAAQAILQSYLDRSSSFEFDGDVE